MKVNDKRKANTKRYLNPGCLTLHLASFADVLISKGFTPLTIKGYVDSVSHFGGWLDRIGKSIADIDLDCVKEFALHDCTCVGNRKKTKISKKYVKRVLAFVMYLNKNGFIALKTKRDKPLPFLVVQFAKYLRELGLRPKTVERYQYAILSLLPKLGTNTQRYDNTLIQQVVFDSTALLGLASTKQLITGLRAFLRFLSVNSLCTPDLDRVVPAIAQWSLSSVPKYISPDSIEALLDGCNKETHKGVRERAVILLLARLGLRAGDIVDMKIGDIHWGSGTLTVRGKGKVENRLPLPQEVGNAILDYLNNVRPCVNIPSLFLCLNAPIRPLGSSSCVSNIVGAALKRTNIKNVPSYGAHLLRHSAATTLLREGATLDTVSVLLRHNSLDMTMYYAKVDTPSLLTIAQPWPEAGSC